MPIVEVRKKQPARRRILRRPHAATQATAPSTGEEDSGRFYVYIIRLDNGSYYIGQTREIRERMMEHRENPSFTIGISKPKLRYFEILKSRKASILRALELREIEKKNRQDIAHLIREFRYAVQELDYK